MRRGLKTYTTVRAALVACGLYIGIIALVFLISDVPAVLLSLLTLTMAPATLMITGMTAGFIPMGACLAILLAAFALAGPLPVAACAAFFLLPATAVFVICLLRRMPFWHACGLVAGTLLASQMLLFLWLQSRTSGQLSLAAGSLAAQYVNSLPYRDQFLYTLATAGFLQVPSSMQDTAIVAIPGGYGLSAEVINELLLQVRSVSGVMVESMLPTLFISGSGLNALLGLSLGIRDGRRAAQTRAYRREEELQEIPDLGMPPLRDWHLPRPWGLRIAVLGLGYFLARFSSGGALAMLGLLMFQVFALCFSVQGLAALNASQHRRGTGRFWRKAVVVMALLLRFMQIALIILGVIDQITNARGLRPPMQPRGEEDN